MTETESVPLCSVHLLFGLPRLSDPRERQHLQPTGTAGREGDAPS